MDTVEIEIPPIPSMIVAEIRRGEYPDLWNAEAEVGKSDGLLHVKRFFYDRNGATRGLWGRIVVESLRTRYADVRLVGVVENKRRWPHRSSFDAIVDF